MKQRVLTSGKIEVEHAAVIVPSCLEFLVRNIYSNVQSSETVKSIGGKVGRIVAQQALAQKLSARLFVNVVFNHILLTSAIDVSKGV